MSKSRKKDIDDNVKEKIFQLIKENMEIDKMQEYFVCDHINYMLDYFKDRDSVLLKKATKTQLQEFSQIFCDRLNTIYDNFNPINIIETQSFYISVVCYGKELLDNLIITKNFSDDDLNMLIKSKFDDSIYNKKTVRIYNANGIYIIKPKEYKFWLKSVAIKDADKTFVDLIKS